jgi:hypothetical protein
MRKVDANITINATTNREKTMSEEQMKEPSKTSLAALLNDGQQYSGAVDLFTAQGFALACRVAKALATSDVVPDQFKAFVKKGSGKAAQMVENHAAIGNCLVAIEVARTINMSIAMVMQHANVINGRLSFSAQYKIGAVNASGRFTPLRFEFKKLGKKSVPYKLKGRWNDELRRYDMIEKTHEVDDVQCIAWAYAKEGGRATMDRVEGAPVSYALAIEEGWWHRDGSKWQTSMRELMLMYRAGAWFSNIHAPDITMGMGLTSEELRDMTTVDMAPDGQVRSVRLDDFASSTPPPMADEVPHDEPDDESESLAAQMAASGMSQQSEPAQARQQPTRQPQPAVRRTRGSGMGGMGE